MSTITPLQTTDTGAASLGIINTNVTNLNTDKLEKSGGTLTGQIAFSGTTHAGVKLNSLTTTERNALTPANGMIIYNTTTGQVEKYESGSWVGATGVANASSTVEGIVELATQAEIDNDTATGGTGAALAITPDQLALSKYGTGMPSSDEKAALAGTSGTPSASNKYVTNDDTATAATADKVARRLAGGNITVVTESAGNNSTNAASTAYVDTAIGVLGDTLNGMVASDTLIVSADTEQNTPSTSYTKKKEIKIKRPGQARIKFDLRRANGGTAYGQIYVNGTATGSEQTTASDSYVNFSQDLSDLYVNDLVQLYIKHSTGGANGTYIRNFRIYYDLASVAETKTILD